MHRLAVILLSGAAVLLPVRASAQSAKLEICNNGSLDVDIAVAARIQSFVTGYTWKTRGWFTVNSGTCSIVYDEDYDEAGPYTPQSGARVAFTVTRDNGDWRAYRNSRPQSHGWMRTGTGQLCVKHPEVFTFERPAGDPSANCGGVLIPVAYDFVPDGAGKFTYTMDWEGDESYVTLGTGGQERRSVATTNGSDSVDNGLKGQFLRALAKAAKEENDKRLANTDTVTTNAKSREAMLGWVREDLSAYLDASRTGFESFKTGEPWTAATNPGDRIWNSSSKPALADGCWVLQGASTRFMCSMPLNPGRDKALAYYTQLSDDVTASLPADWSKDAAPPYGGDLPSVGYRSTTGAHGEIWLENAQAGGGYTLKYELVAGATQAAVPQPANSSEDDPIGEGGFITPPTPPAPPAPPPH